MTIAQIIGLIVVLVVAVLCGILIAKKSKKNDLFKWIALFIGVSIALTWIFVYGYFNGTEFVDYGMNQQGLSDITQIIYYSIYFAGDKIIFLLSLGAVYAVLSKCSSYKKFVTTIAKKIKGKEITFVLISSLFFTIMSSILIQSFIPLIFVPFVVSVLLDNKLDKITAFCATFGSMLIGTLGTTYGGEGFYWFNYYIGSQATTGIVYRLIILVVAFILFNFFTVMHAKKVLNAKKSNEVINDPFKVEKVEKDAKCWPTIVLFGIIFVLIILGYIDWAGNFGIECFNKFHTWLMGLQIGELNIFEKILGTLSKDAAFGTWNLFHMSIVLIIVSVLAALIGKIKLDDFIDAYGEGFKKMGKAVLLFIAAYMVMVAAYMSPYVPTITNMIFGKLETFNPFLVTFDALIANIFHIDFGYTGYVVTTYLTSTYTANIELIHTIFTTMYGFVSLCLPTSGLLLIGLSYLDIDYKTWIKYIWIFILAILIILLVLFTVIAYI